MEGKDIDRFVKDSIQQTANDGHPEGPDHTKNWQALEAALDDKPEKKRTWLYIAAAAIALLLFSNFFWLLEQRTYKDQITAIVFEYEQELAKKPPATPDPDTAPRPETAPQPIPAPQPEEAPEPESAPEIKIVYVDRIVEVPVEVPVYIQPQEPELTIAEQPEMEDPQKPTVSEPDGPTRDRKDLIPPSTVDHNKKKKAKNKAGQRSFGLKLALNQN